MSEEIIPDVVLTSDVPETVENIVEEAAENHVSYSEKTLAEIVRLFEELMNDEGRMKRAKDAEALKAAFYKRLQKEKFDAGLTATDVVPAEQTADEQEVVEETEDTVSENPFAEIEKGFKDLYNRYRNEKADYNRQLDKEREDNLAAKEQVIADLKNLIEKQEDVNATFPEFREIQNRWRAAGPVPAQNFRNINETYQLYVEQFYDMVKINRELRDLDFKKNLEAKEQFCQAAEQLAENSNVVEAFRELQKLHEQWKEYGPVAKEYREQIWDRFKAATAVINKKYQAFFEGLKEQQAENLAKKTVLCEKVEEIAQRAVLSSNQWNAFSKEIEDVQKEWKLIGFASKKDNQKIYDRFRAACDNFYGRKREFYTEYKDNMNANLERKIALCEEAEQLGTAGDVIAAFRRLQDLHEEWRGIGPVAPAQREELWIRFKAASTVVNKRHQDHFDAIKTKETENEVAKIALCEKIEAIDMARLTTMKDWEDQTAFVLKLQEEWRSYGFASKKVNTKLFERFRKSCDDFFGAKAEYFRAFKDTQSVNVQKKEKLCQMAEELMTSTEWRKTTDRFINLQREWKQVGPVPRKLSTALWTRFVTACDTFFAAKEKAVGGEKQVENENLQKKQEIISRLNTLKENIDEVTPDQIHAIRAEWNAIGHVPFKEKDKIFEQYQKALDFFYQKIDMKGNKARMNAYAENVSKMASGEKAQNNLMREREKLMRAYERMTTELKTYENNIGFLSLSSKGGNSLIREIEKKKEALKADIRTVVEKIELIDKNL